jgi:hypothetical protein
MIHPLVEADNGGSAACIFTALNCTYNTPTPPKKIKTLLKCHQKLLANSNI